RTRKREGHLPDSRTGGRHTGCPRAAEDAAPGWVIAAKGQDVRGTAREVRERPPTPVGWSKRSPAYRRPRHDPRCGARCARLLHGLVRKGGILCERRRG